MVLAPWSSPSFFTPAAINSKDSSLAMGIVVSLAIGPNQATDRGVPSDAFQRHGLSILET